MLSDATNKKLGSDAAFFKSVQVPWQVKSHVPASAAGPYNKMHANTEENQLRDLPRTLSMMSATTLTPTAAPMNALDTATIPLTSSDTKLVPLFNAGAGSTNVNRATMSARTAVVQYMSFAVSNEYTRNLPKYSKKTVRGEE